MPTFILSLNWTDQGIRSVKDAPKRANASKELARKLGLEIKEVYITSGANDILIILDAPNGDNVAKFALALSSQGNVRTRTARAWPQSEFQKLITELPQQLGRRQDALEIVRRTSDGRRIRARRCHPLTVDQGNQGGSHGKRGMLTATTHRFYCWSCPT